MTAGGREFQVAGAAAQLHRKWSFADVSLSEKHKNKSMGLQQGWNKPRFFGKSIQVLSF